MQDEAKSNLFTHITNIGYSLLQQVTSAGTVLVKTSQGINVDMPSMHHITEFMRRLDAKMFEHYIRLAVSWLADPKNNAVDSQFGIDTISSVAPDSDIV